MQVGNSIYSGDFLDFLYLVMDVGNETVEQGSTRVLTGIAKERALPKLSQTSRPLSTYTTGKPSADTVTTTYAERTINPQKMTLFEDFLPEDFFNVFPSWQPVGDLSNLRQNPELLADAIELYFNNAGTQMSELFWQGDTTAAVGSGLEHFNGIVTRLKSDPNAIAVTPAGVITKANVIDRVSEVWQAIPNKFRKDKDFAIHMNTEDFKLLQLANLDAKKTTTGVLTTDIERLFLESRIMDYDGLPKDHIVGAKGMADSDDSNLFLGYWVELESENPVIDKVDNAGKLWFVRLDVKADANYRVAEEIVFYEPS